MNHDLSEWKLLLETQKLQNLLLESGTRYSVEVNFRTSLEEAKDHFAKLVLGYVMASLKQHNFFVKHVFTQKPYRLLVSTRSWEDGEWVGILNYNENQSCFVFTPGVYSKMRGTASFKDEESKKCLGTSASEISKEIIEEMNKLKDKPLRDGERLNPALRKRGPRK